MIYIASPYTHEDKEVRQQRYEVVANFCAEAFIRGFKIFSPICHWHPIATNYELPKEVGYWRDWNREILRLCEALWVLTIPGYKQSTGVHGEIIEATVLNLPIYYVREDEFISFQAKGENDV